MNINRRQKIAMIMGLISVLLGLGAKFFAFPRLLDSQMHKKINLKPGSDVRAIWSNVPFPIDFRIYLFNVTNPDDIKNGAKPILQEVGPYYFEEKHEKTNLTDKPDNDSVEYSIKNTFTFKPEKSGNLDGEEELILPHIFMMSMIMATARDKPSALPIVGKAINSIFKNPENVFVKAKAMDLMFRGLPIDCAVKDFAGKAACGMLRNKTDSFIFDDPDHFRFSIFGATNGTSSKNRIKVLRGGRAQNEIGQVIEFNGKKNISIWNDKYCDTFNGTDGYVFHPNFKENDDIMTFAPDICRSMSAYRIGKSHVLGLQTHRYTIWLGDPNTDPSLKCYCPTSGCLKAGVMDLHKCMGIPLVVSNPHFYRVDEDYLRRVHGLYPNQEKHETYIDFDLLSGSVVQARKRLQFNIMISKLDKLKMMSNFPEALLPLFWIEEGLVVPEPLIANVKGLHKIVGILFWASWIFISLGFLFLLISGFSFYWASQTARHINKVTNPLQTDSFKISSTRRGSEMSYVKPTRPANLPSSLD